jgi:hypothetical protein
MAQGFKLAALALLLALAACSDSNEVTTAEPAAMAPPAAERKATAAPPGCRYGMGAAWP